MLDLLWRSINLLLALLGSASEAKDEMEGRLFLDVVVGEGTAVFELLASEDQALLVGWDALFVCCDVSDTSRLGLRMRPALDFGLDVVNGIRRLHLEGDSLAREGLDEAVFVSLEFQFSLCVAEGSFRELTFASCLENVFSSLAWCRCCRGEKKFVVEIDLSQNVALAWN